MAFFSDLSTIQGHSVRKQTSERGSSKKVTENSGPAWTDSYATTFIFLLACDVHEHYYPNLKGFIIFLATVKALDVGRFKDR